MDFDRIVRELLAAALDVDVALRASVQELVDAGEPDLAMVLLLECAPELFDEVLVDSIEAHFRGSGEYVEPQALAMVSAYRAPRVA